MTPINRAAGANTADDRTEAYPKDEELRLQIYGSAQDEVDCSQEEMRMPDVDMPENELYEGGPANYRE